MLKKIGLSAAAIVAAVALAQLPAQAADRDDYGYRNSSRYTERYNARDVRNYRGEREYRERMERERMERQRFEWRERQSRGWGWRDRDRDWR